jgi:hypothetical protein
MLEYVMLLSLSLCLSVTAVNDSDPQSKAYVVVVVQCLPFITAMNICDITDICAHPSYSSVYIG